MVKKSRVCPEGTHLKKSAMESEAEEKPPSPIDLFIQKVTMTGIREAFEDDNRFVRYMFSLAITAGIIGIIYESIMIANQYSDQSSVIISSKPIPQQAPYPNVSICYPFFINITSWTSMVTSVLKSDEKAMTFIKNHNISIDEITRFSKRTASMDVSLSDINTPIYIITKRVYDSISKQLTNQDHDSWSTNFIPDCKSILSDCFINDTPFDCCKWARPMAIAVTFCYQIEVNQLSIDQDADHNERGMRLQMHVKTDWEFGIFDNDNTASDGYHLYIDTVPIQLKIPVSVPTAMDASVILAEPKKHSELGDCIPNNRVPKLNHFQYYDPQGILCVWETLTDYTLVEFGCRVPAASYFPVQQPCTFAQLITWSIMLSAIGGVDDVQAFASSIDRKKLEAFNSYVLSEKDRMMAIVRQGTGSPCKRLCSRWEYPIYSVSYSEIEYRDQAEKEREMENTSWSRLNIIMPYTTSMSHEEKDIFSTSYLTMCDIGGVMGVYLGFSMITIVQICVYGPGALLAALKLLITYIVMLFALIISFIRVIFRMLLKFL